MAKPVDTNELFSKCMASTVDERLTATTVSTYLTSQFKIHFKDEYLMLFDEYY